MSMTTLAEMQKQLHDQTAVKEQYAIGKELRAKGKKEEDPSPPSSNRGDSAYYGMVNAMAGAMTVTSQTTLIAAAQIEQQTAELAQITKEVNGINDKLNSLDPSAGAVVVQQETNDLSTELMMIQTKASGIEMKETEAAQAGISHPEAIVAADSKLGGAIADFASQWRSR